MTPERARELSEEAWRDMEDCKEWNAPLIKAILKACGEQREEDARICMAQGDKSGDDYEAGGCYGCEIAIREGK